MIKQKKPDLIPRPVLNGKLKTENRLSDCLRALGGKHPKNQRKITEKSVKNITLSQNIIKLFNKLCDDKNINEKLPLT
jgi:hypothetical protein